MNLQNIAVGFLMFSFFFPVRAVAANLEFSKLYVFGDSLSDIGNIYSVTKAANLIDPSITITPPSPPYDNGRFSNGSIWVDDLASVLGLMLIPSTQLAVGGSVTSSFQINYNYGGATAGNSVDFAFGGAESGTSNIGSSQLPGVLREIQSFTDDLKVAHQSADPNALYIVSVGGFNDYNSKTYSNPDEPTTNIVQAVTSLYGAGARNILVPNLSDLGKTPYAATTDSDSANYLTQLSLEHNAELETKLKNLPQNLADINIIYLDQSSLFKSALAEPAALGLTNISDSCLTKTDNSFYVCKNPNNYLFWDSLHPTATAHEQLANFTLETLEAAQTPQPVPEPDSILPVVLGLGWWLYCKNRGR